MNMMKKLFLLMALTVPALCQAQTRWIDPIKEGAEVHGSGWEELRHSYVRLPDKAENTVRSSVWGLSRSSAGKSLVFRSNAGSIKLRYQLGDKEYSMFHMQSTGKSGLDLYAIDKEGAMRWCAADFTPSFADTVVYRYSGISYYPEKTDSYEFHLYLPLYNRIKWLEIGIPEDAEFEFLPVPAERPIVVYGTSIAQGACASRPGMAWSNIIERELRYPVVNLGFSGNGKLEPEVFDLLDEIDAGLYILDCLPNLSGTSVIFDRAIAGVRRLREHHDCPILLVENCGHTNEYTKDSYAAYRADNDQLRRAYEALLAEGVQEIYYLTCGEIGFTMDSMVEGVHPTDIGMRNYADAYIAKIRAIFGR